MQLEFVNTATSDVFQADCDGNCTALLAVQGLIESGFVEKPTRGSYDLVHEKTEKLIPTETSFDAAGVLPGDRINVYHRGSGASLDNERQAGV